MGHNQHSKLTKLDSGFYSRNEISILGSNCETIQMLAFAISTLNQDYFSIAYIDAEHSGSTKEDGALGTPFTKELTDKIGYHQLDIKSSMSDYEKYSFFNSINLSLINGNHQQANHQIVIVDQKKEASLTKRKEALTNVIAIISTIGEELPEYIKKLIPRHTEIPIFSIQAHKEIGDFVKEFVERRRPEINGLILGGGKSKRMGTDKAFIDYHGMPQHAYLQSLMTPFCKEVFVSCRSDQSSSFLNPIPDSFLNIGAFGGLLSAFQKVPTRAWLTVACDIPLLNKDVFETLVANRNPNKLATCFYNSKTDFPEPLITIWEPKAYPVLLHYLSRGYSCPRKILINSDVEVVKLGNDEVLLNANTFKERNIAIELISNR